MSPDGTADESTADQPLPEDMTFEDAVDELESIIERLERGAIGLEESLDARRRGESLLRRCRGVLDAAEQEIERLDDAARRVVSDEAERDADPPESEAG